MDNMIRGLDLVGESSQNPYLERPLFDDRTYDNTDDDIQRVTTIYRFFSWPPPVPRQTGTEDPEPV